jgi:hypothetical protein
MLLFYLQSAFQFIVVIAFLLRGEDWLGVTKSFLDSNGESLLLYLLVNAAYLTLFSLRSQICSSVPGLHRIKTSRCISRRSFSTSSCFLRCVNCLIHKRNTSKTWAFAFFVQLFNQINARSLTDKWDVFSQCSGSRM